MRRSIVGFGLLAPILLGCARRGVEPSDFKAFTSAPGRFTAEFPGDPAPTDQTVRLAIGPMVVHMFHLQLGPTEYTVEYCDPPANLTDAQRKAFNVDAALEGSGSGIASGAHARIVKVSKITLGKWPGREWNLEGTGEGNEDFRWRCCYANQRQYQIAVGWLKGNQPSEEIIGRFLNSLRVSAD